MAGYFEQGEYIFWSLKDGKFLDYPLTCLIFEEIYLTINTWLGLFVS
jgi:hypothetical protein